MGGNAPSTTSHRKMPSISRGMCSETIRLECGPMSNVMAALPKMQLILNNSYHKCTAEFDSEMFLKIGTVIVRRSNGRHAVTNSALYDYTQCRDMMSRTRRLTCVPVSVSCAFVSWTACRPRFQQVLRRSQRSLLPPSCSAGRHCRHNTKLSCSSCFAT